MDLEQLLAVGDVDILIAQLEHRLGHDPVHQRLVEAGAELRTVETELLDLFGRRDAVRQELKRLEDEAAMTEEKIAKVDQTLYGGTVTAHKELEALQHELGTLREILSGIEDRELEQMELAEPLEAESVRLEARRDDVRAALTTAEEAVTVMQAEVGAELDAQRARRAELAGALPESLMKQYETSRRSAGGSGAARLAAGGQCEGCHLKLPSAEYDAIKHAPADEVHLCPECNRILVRSN